MDVVIGIDSSTTATKAVAFDASGAEVACGRAAISRHTSNGTWQEQDPTEWWTSTVTALTDVAAQLSASGHRARAIGITHQRESFACLDEEFAAVRPAILWLDARAGDQVRRLGDSRVHELTGKPPSTTPSYYKLAWLAENEPEALSRTQFVTDVHGYLSRQLTGRFVTSIASADPMGIVDLARGDWSDVLLDGLGLRRDMLPELVPAGAVIGRLTKSAAALTGLPADLIVVAGAGDGQCGGLGSGATSRGSAYLSLGTSITLGTQTNGLAPSSLAYRVLCSPLGTGSIVEGFISSGALSVSWYRSTFLDPAGDSLAEAERALNAMEPGTGGLRFLPHLGGAGTPHWDDRSRGAFVGIDETHERFHFLHAVLEGLAFEIGLVLEGLETVDGPVREVVVMGGGAASPAWLRIIADVLNRPLLLSPTNEGAALGAAVLAAGAVDPFPGDAVTAAAAMVHQSERIEPQPARASAYADLAHEYRAIYPALTGIFGRQQPRGQDAQPLKSGY